MKTIHFLTLVLAANFAVAVVAKWPPLNKWLVVINAAAVLVLIAMRLYRTRRD